MVMLVVMHTAGGVITSAAAVVELAVVVQIHQAQIQVNLEVTVEQVDNIT
jgi:hypothetical protein